MCTKHCLFNTIKSLRYQLLRIQTASNHWASSMILWQNICSCNAKVMGLNSTQAFCMWIFFFIELWKVPWSLYDSKPYNNTYDGAIRYKENIEKFKLKNDGPDLVLLRLWPSRKLPYQLLEG